jgi:glucose-fructose oxidoreductase
MKNFKIAGISFDHMHMGDLLRQVHEYSGAEICGICDDNPANQESVQRVVANFDIPQERVFQDYRQCLEKTQPDVVILCPATARHGEWVEKVAPYDVHVLVEKPFAASLAEADRMIAAMQKSGKQMVINWPLAWYPPHVTSKRLIDEGTIGEVTEVHFYDGNRGPMRHVADKVEISEEEAAQRKSESWFYQKDQGGGSLQDYLGYGTTLGTWFHNGQAPTEVIAMVDEKPGLEVDEHSITVARYTKGLSKFETRWGTFTDPWTMQPQPKCGFVIVGSKGTISSYDYADTIRVQTEAHPEGQDMPVDTLQAPLRNPIEHLLDVIENGAPVHGPLDPRMCRIGQQIVDAAAQSAREKRAVPLPQ